MLTLIVSACGAAGSCAPCPTLGKLTNVGLGQWMIVDSTRSEMVGGSVQVGEDTILINFTRNDGSSWRVTYRITEISR